MKKYFVLISLISGLYADINLDKNYYFGFSISRFDKVYQNKIKSVSYRLAEEFKEFLEEKHTVIPSFVDNEEQFIKDFVSYQKYNIIIVYSELYLREKEKLKSTSSDIYSFLYKDSFRKFVIIANKNSNISSLSDIKGKKFAHYTKSENSSIWLDYLTLKELGKPYKKLISYEKKYLKDKTALLDIFFNKVDFAVVRKKVYDDMILLNPTIKNKIKIIRISKPIFPYALAFIHKKTPKKMIDIFNKFSENGIFNKKFEHLYLLLDQTSLQKISYDELKPLELLYNEYLELKKSKL